ncbi:MFS transporter [Sporosarcina psychrophila]|uniref:MFS family permease n=1 Tax=Sporosarcina psychrophila TaxID=1476 RepID=A0ABV2KDI6_SPOPS
MKRFYKGLWKHSDFKYFWAGQTISMFGNQIAMLALPLVAALTLKASALQIGILQAVEFLPFILLSLFAGVWIDRKPKRPILIVADLSRAIIILGVPISMFLGILSMEILYIVAFLAGGASVLSNIGQMSYLPVIIKRKDLMEGNSKLEFSNSAADLTGQGIGGILIQIFTAPFTLIIQSLSLIVSSIFLFRIKTKENVIELNDINNTTETRMLPMIKEGLTYVLNNKIIRALLVSSIIFNFFTVLIDPIYILYLSRTLSLEPIYIGLIFSMAGVGALIGAAITEPITRKLGIGNSLIISLLIAGISSLLLPIATLLPVVPAVLLLMLMQLVDACMLIIYNINQRTLRTVITPDKMLGRMNSSIRFCVMGIVPIAAVLGGLSGDVIGVLETLIIGALGIIFSSIYISTTMIRTIKDIPIKN